MKKHIYIVLFSILITSCDVEEFLDVKPTGSLIPETVEHYDKLLENPTIHNGTWSNLAYMDPDVYLSDALYENLANEYSKRQYEWQADTYEVEGSNSDDTDWKNKYRSIYNKIHANRNTLINKNIPSSNMSTK